MNGDVSEHWMKQHLLPYVAGNSCIVIDHAPYHTMLTDDSKPAAINLKREELIDWLIAHGAKDEGELLSKERFLSDEMAHHWSIRSWMKTKRLDKAVALCSCCITDSQTSLSCSTMNGTDIRLLLLPVAHPVLNPIELMWGQIKRYVRDNNCDFTITHIRELAEQKYRSKIQEHGMLPFSTHGNMPPNNGRLTNCCWNMRRAMQMTRRAMGIRMMTRRHRRWS